MMTHLRLSLASLLAITVLAANAQGLRLPTAPPAVATGAGTTGDAQRSADFIVAVVNSEPITNFQVRQEVQRSVRQLASQQQGLQDARVLADQALERLINDRAQLQMARATGIKVDETAVDDAEQAVARQNQTDLAEMRIGQPAKLTFDAYPDIEVKGHVASIGAGTGSEFSVLPAQNANGNWVKVTQRVPVRIAIDTKPSRQLLAGLSTHVSIDTSK